MSYKGWTYDWDDDHSDDDVRKISHYAVNEETGQRIDLDLSPYLRSPSYSTFQRLIDLGFPTRSAVGSPGPLTEEEVAWLARRDDPCDDWSTANVSLSSKTDPI